MDAIDKLLAQIKAEYDEVQPEKQQPPKSKAAKQFISSSPKSASLVDNLLAEVKADFAAQDETEELKKQQELEKEQFRQAQIKAKQLETLKVRAKEWLDKLDSFSPEGLWFERFAEGYPSKLEAAIEYLQSNE
ncbi:salt stress protein, Slr1339 family [Halotia branconii]|uniref:Uncharacterized protein n=1 Tax=Halotia branconii CENA392 TaxID=1539056 RepID=A0AAJ6NUR7_9CYAN|nr:hypothetical protein [Halotia branconii]WGV26888.1 hypothetical protein QI031_05140 [Halotia branconii CENA392]